MASDFSMDGENSASTRASAIVHDASSISGDDIPPEPTSDETDPTQLVMVPGQENQLEDWVRDGGNEGEENEEDDDDEDGNSVDDDEDGGRGGEEDQDENSVDNEGGVLTDDKDNNFGIEGILGKRIWRGDLQYLIKWIGLPESDNTWMPIEKIRPFRQPIRQMLHAFEERLESLYGKDVVDFPPCKGSLHPPINSYILPNYQIYNQRIPKQENENEPKPNEIDDVDRLAARFQGANISSGNGQVNCQSVQGGRLSGAKKRKAGLLNRWLAESERTRKTVFVGKQSHRNTMGEVRNITRNTNFLGNQSHANTVGEARNTSSIVKIIKPIEYAKARNGTQEVLLTFIALRDDGAEIVMTNNYLKAHHPLLLIDYYEKHIRPLPSYD